jgi:gamma-glutamylcyclotransferase (GGCT)/AIG2-like uncharacterized protein YtfP
LSVRLFVYGTLAPGHDAWAVLEPWVVGDWRADAVIGRLYDTGRGYPAATFEPDPEPDLARAGRLVHGTVVTLDPARATAALDALDRYEGHEYDRIAVRTQAGLDVATYAWTAPLTGCRPLGEGRWVDRPQDETPGPDGR